jgi:signal transduction histidine kinase
LGTAVTLGDDGRVHPALVVAVPLVLAAVALLAFQRGYLAARRNDDARVRLLVEIVSDAMAVVGDRSASDSVVQRLAEILDADAAAVGMVDGRRLQLFGMYGYPDGVRNHSLEKGEGLSGRAWELGQPLVVPDVRREPDYLDGNGGVRSGVYVPGKARGRVAVVVAVESRRTGAYTAKDLLLITPVADLLASMLESRRMLREAEQLEERLLTLVGHEMRTPLTTIFGTLTTLRHYADRVDEASRDSLLDAGLRASRRLERLVEELLMAARLDADDVAFRRTPVFLHGIVTEAVAASGVTERVAIDVPADLGVTADTVHLGTVLSQLVENAVVHGGDGPVDVPGHDLGAGLVAIEVRDYGPGIPEDEQEAALGRFRRIGEHSVPGTGLGLYLARRLVEGMGGELELRSARDAGCVVVVRLPTGTPPPDRMSGSGRPGIAELPVPLARPPLDAEQPVARRPAL